MSGASKSATLSNEVVADLEDALRKMKLLKMEVAIASSSSTKNDALKLDIRKSELDALEFTLQADRMEFENKQKAWVATKGGAELKAEKAKLDAERLRLEDEKCQLRYAQMQQKAAQARLEDAILIFEAAQTQLEEARKELETARAHLEAVERQTDINNATLRAAKSSLEASKMRFEAAANDLNDAKSKFEDAKTQLEVAAASIITLSGSRLEEENKELKIQVSQLESSESKLKGKINELTSKTQRLETEISNLREANADELKESQVELEKVKDDNKSLKAENSKLTDDKVKSEIALTECSGESQRLDKEKSELKKDKERLENELKASRTELEQVKKENISLKAENDKSVTFEGVKLRNPVVFFDMKVRGAPKGRIVMELYADTCPRLVEIFRALCVGGKLLPGTDRLVGYQGTDIVHVNYHADLIHGGNLRVENRAEIESIYGYISPAEKSSRKATGLGDLYININYHERPPYRTSSFMFSGTGSSRQTSDGSFPVIGRVIQGIEVLNTKSYGLPNGFLDVGTFTISDCGQLA